MNTGDVYVDMSFNAPRDEDPLTRNRTNPFIAKVAMSPSSKRSVSPADDGISLLREGVARMDIASRTAGAELASAVSRESTTSGRDVSQKR